MDLSSRHCAAELRQQITTDIPGSGQLCVLDFREVRFLSHSFPDELMAMLVEEYGEECFKTHLRIEGLSPILRQTVLEAVRDRLSAVLVQLAAS